MTKELFSADQTEANVADLDQLFTDLVGEGKKYQDPKVLLKSRLDADEHIRRIERENADLRVDLQARQAIEDALAKLSTPSSNEEQKPIVERNETPLTPQEVEQIIERELAKRTTQNTVAKNQAMVVDTLKKAWGDNYSAKLRARAKELELGEEFLTQLAQTQPQAFLKLVDAKPASDPNYPIHPTSTRHVPVGTTEKTWKYYSKMRRENPSQYHSLETQKEMFKQAQKLGESFYN